MFAPPALPQELESTSIVHFQDCDAFQHLNNSRYIDYFMNAREDQLRQFYNFEIYDVIRNTNHGWVVSKNQIAYLAPALMQEHLIIRTRLISLTKTTMLTECVMLDRTAQQVKAMSWIEFTFVSLQTGRSAQHPQEIMEFFSQVVVDTTFTAGDFLQRIEEIKIRFRKIISLELDPSLAI